jgi:hypothetical protein
MQLSAELFKQISAQLRATGATGKDKRKTPRVGMRNQVLMTAQSDPAAPSKPTRVMVRDLSPCGICVLCHFPLICDHLFALELPMSGGGELVAVYQVKVCGRLEKGLYRLGASLVRLRQPEEVRQGETAVPAAL